MNSRKKNSVYLKIITHLRYIMYLDKYVCLNLQYRSWGHELDEGRMPEGFQGLLEEVGAVKLEKS